MSSLTIGWLLPYVLLLPDDNRTEVSGSGIELEQPEITRRTLTEHQSIDFILTSANSLEKARFTAVSVWKRLLNVFFDLSCGSGCHNKL